MFFQLLDFLDRNDFKYLARKYGGDKYAKQFTYYNQLTVPIFVVKVFAMMLSWSPRPMHQNLTTLDFASRPSVFYA